MTFPTIPNFPQSLNVGGFNFDTPNLMSRQICASASITINDSTTAFTSATAGFWTAMNERGVAVDSNFTAGVAKQILSVTGAGLVNAIVGPVGALNDVITFTIALDGVTYTIATTLSAAQRSILYCAGNAHSDFFTVAARPEQDATTAGLTSDKTTIDGGQVYLWGWPNMAGNPLLRFRTSLTVSITHSAGQSGTANQERQSGVMYRVTG